VLENRNVIKIGIHLFGDKQFFVGWKAFRVCFRMGFVGGSCGCGSANGAIRYSCTAGVVTLLLEHVRVHELGDGA
jgi:hypothetical protein